MADHKRQHFVPQSYLRAWCDLATPEGHEPFVWRFNKDGSTPRRKAPANLFHETDLYTIPQLDGGRELVLEQGLASLESEFVAIRATLARLQMPTPRERLMLCAFIAAAHARTPAQRDHLGGQWAKVLEQADHIKDWAKTATPEEKRAAAPVARGSGPSFTYEDVKRLAEQPMQTMLIPQITAATPLLVQLDLVVLNSGYKAGFITSDNPCVWFDPEAYKRPPFYQTPALLYKSIEITLPVSPRQMILLNRRRFSGHVYAPERAVDELNRRTRAHCADYFVSDTSSTKPIWFDLGVEPEDSWRTRNPT